MSPAKTDIIPPEELKSLLKEEPDVDEKIRWTSEVIISVLKEIGNKDDISQIRNIILTLINQEEIYQRLFLIYREVYTISDRLAVLLNRKDFGLEEKVRIQRRATEIVNEQVFLTQQEIFFKIVNAKEIAEGEKNEDGPALLFPGIEKTKNELINHIQAQTQQLRPTTIDICKSFQGIADIYIETEQLQADERGKYDTIYQSFGLERRLKEDINSDISLTKIDDLSYVDHLIEGFENLKKVYRQKIKSLEDKESEQVINYFDKIRILEEGSEKIDKRIKPLKVLKNLVKRFPGLEKQLDFFTESHYQARAVITFIDEVNEEMGHVFKQFNLESFTVISFLHYKLNGTSHMYESIHYYYAVVQMEKDVRNALKKRHEALPEDEERRLVDAGVYESGIKEIVVEMHKDIAEMNERNYDVHMAFMEYKLHPEIETLRNVLVNQTEKINALLSSVKKAYKTAQMMFFSFLAEDLGSTSIIDQFNNYLRERKDLRDADEVRKGYNGLLATKKKAMVLLEKELLAEFEEKLNQEQISAMALLKIKKDFQRELLLEIQAYPRVQNTFIHILKEFIKLQEDQDNSHKSDNTLLQMIQHDFTWQIEQFKKTEAELFKKIYKKNSLSERDVMVAFVSANITPQEMESFSRLLPGLPRNELQLDSPYGRLLLDIKSIYREQLSAKAASLKYLQEKIYEKRERIKLVIKINNFFKICTEPFISKIDNEENKINNLIGLERRKYQKELGEIIRFWLYLVQEQISPGQGVRGKFRNYRPEEKQLMMKHINPEQLNTIERQLQSSYDLTPDSKLFEVEYFLMEIVAGLFKNFRKDSRIKNTFIKFEHNKKISWQEAEIETDENILDNPGFVPNIKRCIAQVEKLKRQETIALYLDYWEYLIDQHVPASDKRKIKETSKVDFFPNTQDSIHHLTDFQLEQIIDDFSLVQKIRDNTIQQSLIASGLPVLKTAQRCFKIFKEDSKDGRLRSVDEDRLHRMTKLCKNTEFESALDSALNSLPDTY